MRSHVSRIFDEYLVTSARAGDVGAFTRLAENWQKRLLAHAYRLTGIRNSPVMWCRMLGLILSGDCRA